MTDDTPIRRSASRNAIVALALLLALIAVLLGGYAAWRATQFQHAEDARNAQTARFETRLVAAERDVAASDAQRQDFERRLNDVMSDDRATRDTLQGIDQRMRNLETVQAALTDQQANGHDALLLDDAEFLLRAGQQRYVLFNDAASALQAYSLAERALAQVQDPAYQPARVATANERTALAAAVPSSGQHAIDVLNALRTSVPSWPLAEPEVGSPSNQKSSLWSHLWHAFSGVLRVERDESAPLPAADARFARELTALDLAQAQAALLVFDDAAYRAALQRVEATLAARFDNSSPDVQVALADVRGLLAAKPLSSTPPQLGGALATLRDLRATHASKSIALPAPSSTAGAPKPR